MKERAMAAGEVVIHHNLDPNEFVWLWMKYVSGANDSHHCTNVLRGRYSKKFSKHNPTIAEGAPIVCDEFPHESFKILYVCGVAKRGYRKRQNYPHNLHLPIQPAIGKKSEFIFEGWRFLIENGVALPVPAADELPERYRFLPPEYTTCRIFRWAVCHFLSH